MAETADPLSLFHPLIAAWFARQVGSPTEVQRRAWPLIAEGRHVLASAPTGTGKTLAAFLWAIDRLATGAWPAGALRVLYVSPLKALNNDVQKNLIAPLDALAREFQSAGQRLPDIRVLTRSGDTPQAERQRMARRPPEILITTPESLNLLLSSPVGRSMLRGLATVILDEVHAVAATKRGTHLVTAIERLALASGEFQRIALSATVRPLSAVASFVGGFTLSREGGEAVYRPRQVAVVDCPGAKRYELSVRFPPSGRAATARAEPGAVGAGASGTAAEDTLWRPLAEDCRRIVARNRSTVIFVNSRRHAEKVARLINEAGSGLIAYAHHGSLARELRLVVEQRLKRGELSAIVATSSLELGIDIGSLDEVVLVGSPFTVTSALQRLGRAGHRVDAASRGTLFALHGRDLVDAAVLVRAVQEGDIEETAPVENPLDVLAQVLVSMTAVETWKVDELYDAVRASFPFRTLAREHFDLVLAMLAGRYADTRLRELSPLVALDAIEGTVRARTGAVLRLYASGGTIPDRGQYTLRAADSGAVIGQLDEEFVWERAVGDSFLFGTHGWRIERIDHQDVSVSPVTGRAGMPPFWRAEERGRELHLASRIASALEEWNSRLDDPKLAAELVDRCSLEPDAATELLAFLRRQREATGTDLPHRRHLLVEHVRDPFAAARAGASRRGSPIGPGKGPSGRAGEEAGSTGSQVVLHTLWGGKVNRAYALALRAAWQERFGWTPEIHQDDDALLLFLSEDVPASEILPLVTSANLQELLRRSLEASGFFGARFRENAGRALLLPKAAAGRRMPLWLTRMRAKNLFEAVARTEDFPILLETWRSCMRDELDLPGLAGRLDELARGDITVDESTTTAPSPFCAGVLWKQTNTLMYEDDTPRGAAGTSLRPDLVRELALSTNLRPRIPRELAAELEGKLARTAVGWAPRGAVEVLELLKERIAITIEEWRDLLAACASDHGTEGGDLGSELSGKIEELAFGTGRRVVVARELLPRIQRALADDEALDDLLAEWLRTRGPVAPSALADVFGIEAERVSRLLEDLVEGEAVVLDRLLEGSDELAVCDRENLERLLRLRRSRARPSLAPIPLERLPLFVARRQGLVERASGPARLGAAMDRLVGMGLPARLWEEEVLPARVEGYRSVMLDDLMRETGLAWFGCGRERIGFAPVEDLELFLEAPAAADREPVVPRRGRFSFWELSEATGLPSVELAERLWEAAWAGRVSSDSFEVVRRGIAGRFRVTEVVDRRAAGSGGPSHRTAPRVRRVGFPRWQSSRPTSGYWYRLGPMDDASARELDSLDQEELDRDRVRLLARRYGVLFRELLENEQPLFQWSRLFRALRALELSGELVSGRFFDGIRGIQFALPAVADELSSGVVESDRVWWVNACDPASLCGVPLEGLKHLLPSRLPTTHVVFRGSEVALVSRRGARELELRVPADDPRIDEYLGLLRDLAAREARPLPRVRVEKVNGEPAAASAYRKPLESFGFVEDFRSLTWRPPV